jgi:hypothetical protein
LPYPLNLDDDLVWTYQLYRHQVYRFLRQDGCLYVLPRHEPGYLHLLSYQHPSLLAVFLQNQDDDLAHAFFQHQPSLVGRRQSSFLYHERLFVCLPNQFFGSVLNGQPCLLELCRLRWLVFLRLSAPYA